MVDTIKGYIRLKDYDCMHFDELLQESKTTISKNTYTRTVDLKNFKITVSFDGNHSPVKLSFNGSLPKYYYGNNLEHLDWNSMRNAIQKLSNNLNVNIEKAALTRVDFGINIPVDNHVYEYISCLLTFPRLKTMRFKESVTFFTVFNSRSFVFYDKISEMNKSHKGRMIIENENLIGKNILRYELQLKKKIKDRFRLEELRVKDLYRDTVQRRLVGYWYNGYKKVVKIPLGKDPEFLFKHHNGVYKYLSYHGIERIGYERLLYKISQLDFNLKDNSVKRSRMRSTVKNLFQEARDNALDKHLIDELDLKIESIKLKLINNGK